MFADLDLLQAFGAALVAVFGFLSLITHKMDEMTTPRYHVLNGRAYEVHTEPSVDAANAFMLANPGYGVLDEVRATGEVLLAAVDSAGVPLVELPAAMRAALEAA